MTDNLLLTPGPQPEDPDAALRPKTLAEFVGQAAAKDNLSEIGRASCRERV